MQDEPQQLVNTIPEAKPEIEYAKLPDGEHLMALVKVKNKPKRKTDPKTGEVKMVPGFQLTFRSKDTPNGYLNLTFKASANDKSDMFKYLKAMSGRKIKSGIPRDQLFAEMLLMIGEWFLIGTEQNTTNGVVWVNIANYDIRPTPSGATGVLGTALDYFEALDEKAKEAKEAVEVEEFDVGVNV